MNDNEVEQRLRAALSGKARAEIGDRRTPPPIDWLEETTHRRRWVAPLAIAASVAVIGAGALASTHLRTPVTVATNTPPPVTVTVGPTPTSTVTTVPTTTAPPSTTSPPSTTTTAPSTRTTTRGSGTATGSGPSTVTIAGARVVVPPGWLARSTGKVSSNQGGSVFDGTCLVRSTKPTSGCVIIFGGYPAGLEQFLDSDFSGGVWQSNPQYCPPSSVSLRDVVEAGDRSLGGRTADFRRWKYNCSDGTSAQLAQYVVPTQRPFILFSDQADAAVVSVMAQLAASATLPGAMGSLRLYDYGVVKSVTPLSGGGNEIVLDRVVPGLLNQSPATYRYVLPDGVSLGGPNKAEYLVGQSVTINTDGTVITTVKPGTYL